MLHPIDLAILVVYLIGITLLGSWMGRRVHNLGDFFMPRRFGAWSMVMHAFGTGTASDQAVSVASSTAQRGLSGIWYQWLWLIPTPFYWLIAPIMRRFRAVTTADVLRLRFDQSVAVLFAVVGIASMSVKIGVMLKGAIALLTAGTGDLIDSTWAIGLVTVLFVGYGMAGGLAAAIVTDFVQGLMTLLFSFILLPFVWYQVGGLAGVHRTITAPEMLSLVAPGKITAFFVVMLGVQALAGIVAQPHIMGVCAAGRTEMDGRLGFLLGNLLKRVCTVAWCLTAIAAVAWYLQHGMQLEEIRSQQFADRLYGDLARQCLPQIMPGLLGVFLASLLAAVMSSCDSFMISSAGLFTENIYRPWRPDRPAGHYLLVGRLASLFVVAGGVLFAFWVPDVVRALEIWFKIAPMTGIAFWMGLLWRRMTVAGAWATTVTGFATWYLTTRPSFVGWLEALPVASSWRLVWRDDAMAASMHEPWQILVYLSAATLAGIVVSLCSKPIPPERLDRFYALTRTPVQLGERIESPCVLPTGVAPAERRMWITAGGLEIPRPSRTSILGFAAAWLAVVVMIGGFWLLFQIGS